MNLPSCLRNWKVRLSNKYCNEIKPDSHFGYLLFLVILAAVCAAMEGGPGNDIQTKASSPASNSQNQDSVIASYKGLIKEQVLRTSGEDNFLVNNFLNCHENHQTVDIKLVAVVVDESVFVSCVFVLLIMERYVFKVLYTK